MVERRDEIGFSCSACVASDIVRERPVWVLPEKKTMDYRLLFFASSPAEQEMEGEGGEKSRCWCKIKEGKIGGRGTAFARYCHKTLIKCSF